MAKVPLSKHNEMVNALPPDRAAPPLRICVLPWRSRRNRSVTDAHRADTSNEYFAVGKQLARLAV